MEERSILCDIQGCTGNANWKILASKVEEVAGGKVATLQFDTDYGEESLEVDVKRGVSTGKGVEIHLCNEHKEEVAERVVDRLQHRIWEESDVPRVRDWRTGGASLRDLVLEEEYGKIEEQVYDAFEPLVAVEREVLQKAIEKRLLELVIQKFGR